MSFELLICLLFAINVNCNQWDGYHRQMDDNLPAISWKDCGQSLIKCDPSSIPEVSPNARIQGGELAKSGEFPWFAFQRTTSNTMVFACGGAILNEWWILTAAHCVDLYLRDNITSFRVLIGSVDKYPSEGVGRWIEAQRIVIHQTYLNLLTVNSNHKELSQELIQWEVRGKPIDKEFEDKYITYKAYKNRKPEYDIALIKLQERIYPVFNETHFIINSICLPKANISNKKEENLMTIGMGNVDTKGTGSDYLKKGVSRMFNESHCIQYRGWNSVCTERRLEATHPLINSSICSGDSGSPNHQYYGTQAIHIGITSVSNNMGGLCSFRVHFVRVSLFMDWIRSYISGTDTRVEAKTNHLLIVTVITTAIIALIICSALLWILIGILRNRHQI